MKEGTYTVTEHAGDIEDYELTTTYKVDGKKTTDNPVTVVITAEDVENGTHHEVAVGNDYHIPGQGPGPVLTETTYTPSVAKALEGEDVPIETYHFVLNDMRLLRLQDRPPEWLIPIKL